MCIRDRGPHPLKSGAPIPGDQTAIRISEHPAARPGQEQLQDACAGSLDESVPGAAAVASDSLSMGMVCLNALNQPQKSVKRG
jgi:hypothetical protein